MGPGATKHFQQMKECKTFILVNLCPEKWKWRRGWRIDGYEKVRDIDYPNMYGHRVVDIYLRLKHRSTNAHRPLHQSNILHNLPLKHEGTSTTPFMP